MEPDSIDMHWLNEYALNIYPTCIAQMLILFESIRTLPAEFRMYRRAWKRKRLNAAEILFVAIKYTAIIAWCCDAAVENTDWPKSGKQCYVVHNISYFAMFISVHCVALAIAWRTYIVFQCSRKVYWILAVALAAHLGLSLWTAQRQPKASYLLQDFCNIEPFKSGSVWSFSLVWYLLMNTVYDLVVTGVATWRLVTNVKNLSGLSQISRVLFVNNIHYVLIVCSANFTEFVYMIATDGMSRSLIGISCAIQIIAGMNLLIKEQDAVHQKGPVRLLRGKSDAFDSRSPSGQPLRYQQTTFSSLNHGKDTTLTSSSMSKLHPQAPFHGITYDLEQQATREFDDDDKGSGHLWSKAITPSPDWDVAPRLAHRGEDDDDTETMHVSYPTLHRQYSLPQSSDMFQQQYQDSTQYLVHVPSSETLKNKQAQSQSPSNARIASTSNDRLSIRTIRAEARRSMLAAASGDAPDDYTRVTPMFEISPGASTPPVDPSFSSSQRGERTYSDASNSPVERKPVPQFTSGEDSGVSARRDTATLHPLSALTSQAIAEAQRSIKESRSPQSTSSSIVASTFGGEYRGSLIHTLPESEQNKQGHWSYASTDRHHHMRSVDEGSAHEVDGNGGLSSAFDEEPVPKVNKKWLRMRVSRSSKASVSADSAAEVVQGRAAEGPQLPEAAVAGKAPRSRLFSADVNPNYDALSESLDKLQLRSTKSTNHLAAVHDDNNGEGSSNTVMASITVAPARWASPPSRERRALESDVDRYDSKSLGHGDEVRETGSHGHGSSRSESSHSGMPSLSVYSDPFSR